MARHELWVELADRPGNLAALAGDLAACGANIVHLDVHAGAGDTVIDRLVVQVPDHRTLELEAVARACGATLRPLDESADTSGASAATDQVGPRQADPRPVIVRSAGSFTGREPEPERPVRRVPVTLERLVALSDGGLVRLRHLSAGDRNELVAHHGRCSEVTRRYSRFLSPALDVDADDTVALTALAGGAIVGVARYELRDGGVRADVAVIVEDAHQRRGIGTLLVHELATLASNAGVGHVRLVTRGGPDRVVRTLRAAGLDATVRREGDALVFDCALPHDLSASA